MSLNLTRSDHAFIWMTAIFITCLLVANLIGSLLFSFEAPWGGTVLLSAGIIPFPVTFVLTDVLNEFYGKHGARLVTIMGFAMSILVYILLWTGEQLPVDSRTAFPLESYLIFSQNYTGMFFASLSAYLIGQFLDITVFGLFKNWSQNRFIWLRATGSTIISQLFDSFIVASIAFYGTLSAEDIFQVATSNYIWKFIIAVLVTPIIYGCHFIVRKYIFQQGYVPKDAIPTTENTAS